MTKQPKVVTVQQAIDVLTTRMEALDTRYTGRDLSTIPNLDNHLASVQSIQADLEKAINIYAIESAYEIYRETIVHLINNRTAISDTDANRIKSATVIRVAKAKSNFESLIDDLGIVASKLEYIHNMSFIVKQLHT